MQSPFISICIPVHNTEKVLKKCLNSIANQIFKDFEVVIINDASSGLDQEGRNCKKIVKAFSKKIKNHVNYVEHTENKFLVETRRDLVYEAKGKYILMVDSDDYLEPEALFLLSEKAIVDDYDIVHGNSVSVYEVNNEMVPSSEKKQSIFNGELHGHDIFKKTFVERTASTFLWGKIIKREVYLNAFDLIPYTKCNYCEDFLIYFFILQFAKSYVGVPQIIYNYRVDTGMSARNKKLDFKIWMNYCTIASAFTVIFSWRNQIKEEGKECSLTEEDFKAIADFAWLQSLATIKLMYKSFDSETLPQARQLLCEYWGEHFVETVEKELEKTSSTQ